MSIKHLLLGAAAPLLFVGGAHAADAVLAEPEPAEYVKVCDAYGAGFFYIPGTETCLQVSGYVYFQAGFSSYSNSSPFNGVDDDDTPSYHFGITKGDGIITRTRGRLNIDARSDTELGTLRSFIRMQATFTGYNTNDGPASIDQAFIQLGGLTLGYTESAYAVTQYGGVANYPGPHDPDNFFPGYQQRDIIAYSFGSAKGFSATISVEDDGYTTSDTANPSDDDNDGYTPDFVGVVTYNADWGGAWARLGYDESADGFGAEVGAQINVPFAGKGSNLRLIAYYADSDNDFDIFGHPLRYFRGSASNLDDLGGAESSYLASYRQQFSDKYAASIDFQYYDNIYVGGTGSDEKLDIDAYKIGGTFVWTPVKPLEVRAELAYQKSDDFEDLADKGTYSGYIRVTRFF